MKIKYSQHSKNLHIFFFTFLFILIVIHLVSGNQPVTYYLSSSGNDFLPGTSPDKAWASLTRLQEESKNMNPGDSILFCRGDTFRGSAKILINGIERDSIHIGAYGEGPSPVISGAEPVTNWQRYEKGIYRAKYSDHTIYNLFFNNKQLTLARYPNSGFLTIENANGKSGFSNSDLAADSIDYTGANVLFRNNNWVWEKKIVKTYQDGAIEFLGSSSYECMNNWGFFLNNSIHFLDSVYEWYYDTADEFVYLKVPEGINPNDHRIEGTVYEHGFYLTGQYCSLADLYFERQLEAGIKTTCRHLSIRECRISETCNYGLYVRNGNVKINNCSFIDINGNGIDLFSTQNVDIKNCTLRNIGLFPELSLPGQQKQVGILSRSSSKTKVEYCTIDSIGYSGILFMGDSCTIEKNLLNHTMMRLNDGGAVYCWGEDSKHGVIRNNIIQHVHGYGEATESGEPKIYPGIYLDNYSNNLIVEQNSVAYAGGGIHGNAGSFNNVICHNVCFGNTGSQLSMADWGNHDLIEQYSVYENKLVSLSSGSLPFNYICYKDICEVENRGKFSHNYYINPWNRNLKFPGNRSFNQWKEEVDSSAIISFYNQEDFQEPELELFVNPADDLKVIQLDGFYLNLDEQAVHELELQPFSSEVLVAIKTSGMKKISQDKPALLQYPNPIQVGEQISKTHLSRNKMPAILIFDLSGKCIINETLQGNYFTIPDHIPTGLYLLKASLKNQISISKIIIQNIK